MGAVEWTFMFLPTFFCLNPLPLAPSVCLVCFVVFPPPILLTTKHTKYTGPLRHQTG